MRQSIKKRQQTLAFKDVKLVQCLVVSSRVLTLKHKVKQRHMTQKQLFICFLKQLKEPFS